MKKFCKIILVTLLTFTAIVSNGIHFVSANVYTDEYKLYPKPQSIRYGNASILRNIVKVMYGSEIDADTKARMSEITALKSMTLEEVNESSQMNDTTATRIYIDTYREDSEATQKVIEHYQIDPSLFLKTDAYFMDATDNQITILGKDSDACFYALTTLYHIVKQMDSLTMRGFQITDYADVESRGFIEGYYGNPWSTQDRINLMKWGGYYKLNSYFYAPKDDPKHNSKWRELYTEEEIATKIRPLAQAGNESKVRFVYALHPYMHSAIRYNSEDNYQEDLKVMQAKFDQVIQAGVRQIAILADDAANVGGENYIRTLTDMTAWLKQKQKEVPDLKITLPFCTQEYMYNGEEYYKRFPENVQIVMTGGRVWGEVSNQFTNVFTQNAGRGPYMWINWPCTDNSKKHVIMGGYSNFLHPNVDPSKLEGIVLNPMQQSEPSKVAIFGNAAYAWNIWESEEEANQAWEDSFSFVNHNSAIASSASNALKELSKHMINQAMDGRVVKLEESIQLKEILDAFKEKLNNETYTVEDIQTVVNEFLVLQKAAKTYRMYGDTDMLGDINNENGYEAKEANEQLAPWIDCWDDTTEAAIQYLLAIQNAKNGNVSGLLNAYAKGQKAFTNSTSHGFFYVDHLEYAEVGVQHIVPFIRALDSYLSRKVQEEVDPNVVTKTFISDVFVNPSSGKIEHVFDENDATEVVYKEPLYVRQNNYIGVQFNRPISVNSIRFLLGTGKNHFFHSKLQYKTSTQDWQDVNSEVYHRPNGNNALVEEKGLQLQDVIAIRLIATQDNGVDSWTTIKSIDINKVDVQATQQYQIQNISLNNLQAVSQTNQNNIKDNNLNTEYWVKDPSADKIATNATITFDLGSKQSVGKVFVGQDTARNNGGDILDAAVLEYETDNNQWETFGNLEARNQQEVVHATGVTTQKIRIRNLRDKNVWWRISEVQIFSPENKYKKENVISNKEHTFQAAIEKESAKISNGTIQLDQNDYLGLDFGSIKQIIKVQHAGQITDGLSIQTSKNGMIWEDVEITNINSKARYIRIFNPSSQAKQLNLQDFIVTFETIGRFGELVSSNIDDRGWGDTRNDGRAFDSNMASATKFGGMPSQGNTVVYSFGKEIPIRSIRIYTADSQVDYIRDAAIETSLDGEHWNSAFQIGDGVVDSDRDTAFGSIHDENKKSDSNYPNFYYYGNDELQGNARYMRIRMLASYPNRALVMNEIMINNGSYISTEANPAFEGTLEERGYNPSHIIDGDLMTAYRPSAENGSLTYHISDSEHVKTIRFIQNGDISNALVTGTVYHPTQRQSSTVEFGRLVQSMNEFNLPKDSKLLDITLSWGTTIPEISEFIMTSIQEDASDAYQQLLEKISQKPQAYESWILESRRQYDEIIKQASALIESEYVSKSALEVMLNSVQAVVDSAKEKAHEADIYRMEEFVTSKISNENRKYTQESYATYEELLKEFEVALQEKENISKETAKALLDRMYGMLASGLKYSNYNRELAELTLEQFQSIQQENFTKSSMDALLEVVKQLEYALSRSETLPQEFIDILALYQQASQNLVNIQLLKATLSQQKEENLYTEESWKQYQLLKEEAKLLLVDGTQEAVDAMIQKLETVLILKTDADLIDLIKELETLNANDYTQQSFEQLQLSIEKAKEDLKQHDENLNKQNFDHLVNLRKALVSIVELNATLSQIDQMDSSSYTKDSWKQLVMQLDKVEEQKQSGTNESINALNVALKDAIQKLQFNAKELDAYREQLIKISPEDYTEQSYAIYEQAYQVLMQLESGNTTVEQFHHAKEILEKAIAGLEVMKADYSKLEELLNRVPNDLSIYTPVSVNQLQQVLQSISYDKRKSQQHEVDEYVRNLEEALRNLILKTQASPNTADTTNTGYYMFISLIALSAMVYMKRKYSITH